MKNLNKELLGEYQILTKTEMQNVSLGGEIPKKDDCVGNGGQRVLGEICRNAGISHGICRDLGGQILCMPGISV